MTVSYTADVANASLFGCFTKILRRWKGSVYKLIYKELTAYIFCYFVLNIFYRTVLCQEGLESYRRWFESIKAYCSIQMSSIPMTFGLGFYVSLIVKRWWDQYMVLPWPDSLAIFVAGLLHGQDERGRMMRRNIMRYTLLSYVITLRRISFRVRKRFPTMDHVIDAGLMRSDELKCMQMLDEKCSVSKWWMPLIWATNIIDQARDESRIKSDPAVVGLIGEISKVRHGLTVVQHYDTISVPLVYTQVVTWSIYSYFIAALMGAQWVRPENPEDFEATYKLPSFSGVFTNSSQVHGSFQNGELDGPKDYQALDLYFPFFLTLQFTFYVGWMKVAETLINPFGEDDDDFELNYLIDRHVQVAYMIVDDMHHNYPELLKDMHWNESKPIKLPYTEETLHYRQEEPKGSAEQREEEDNNYQAYYSILRNKLGGSTKGLETEPYSDYEAVDASSIFGRFKAKLRKSQMRKSSRSSASSAYFRPRITLGNHMDDMQGIDPKSLSPGSRKSTYSRMWSVKFPGRQRRTTVSEIPTHGHHQMTNNNHDFSGHDNNAEFFKNYDAIVNNSPTTTSSDVTDSNSLSPLHGLDRPRQLSTISESQNSTTSTPADSRRNSSQAYPKIDRIFDNLPDGSTLPRTNSTKLHHLPVEKQDSANIESDFQYYPLGSDISSKPILGRRFTVEEVNSNNYEPILFAKHVPNHLRSPKVTPSPILPKRQARMALKALNLSSATLKEDFENAMKRDGFKFSTIPADAEDEDEFEEIDNATVEPQASVPTLLVNGEELRDSDGQKLEDKNQEKAANLRRIFYDPDTQDTHSAFDNATFYV